MHFGQTFTYLVFFIQLDSLIELHQTYSLTKDMLIYNLNNKHRTLTLEKFPNKNEKDAELA